MHNNLFGGSRFTSQRNVNAFNWTPMNSSLKNWTYSDMIFVEILTNLLNFLLWDVIA